MAKELAKFETAYKTLSKRAKGVTVAAATAAEQRVRTANTNSGEGVRAVEDEVAGAIDRGVTGAKLADFLKDAKVKATHKLYETAIGLQKEEIASFQELQAKAESLHKEASLLANTIKADLAKRGISRSKKDIEKLLATVQNDIKTFKAVPPAMKLGPAYLDPQKAFDDQIADIFKKAPAQIKKAQQDRMAPRKLDVKIVNKHLLSCATEAKSAAALCRTAMSHAEKGNASGVAADLKKAAKARDAIAKVAKEYEGLQKSYPVEIDISKDKAKINAAIAKMSALAKDAESKVRGTMTTIKKAGVTAKK